MLCWTLIYIESCIFNSSTGSLRMFCYCLFSFLFRGSAEWEKSTTGNLRWKVCVDCIEFWNNIGKRFQSNLCSSDQHSLMTDNTLMKIIINNGSSCLSFLHYFITAWSFTCLQGLLGFCNKWQFKTWLKGVSDLFISHCSPPPIVPKVWSLPSEFKLDFRVARFSFYSSFICVHTSCLSNSHCLLLYHV